MAKRTFDGVVKSAKGTAAKSVGSARAEFSLLREVRAFFDEYGCRPAKVSPIGIRWQALLNQRKTYGCKPEELQTLAMELAPYSVLQGVIGELTAS